MHLINSDTCTIGAIWMELIDREKLARRMKQMGVSQRELARAAGWKSHSYMRRLLNGEARTLTTDPALRIAHYLHLDVDDIFVTQVGTTDTRAETRPHQRARRSPSRSTTRTTKTAA